MQGRVKAISRAGEKAAQPRARAGASSALQGAAYDVVALVASAGGHTALESILRALGADFSLPIVVMQHLPPEVEKPLRPYASALPFRVEWASEGMALAAGRVLVAPPRSFLDLLPDGTVVTMPCARGARDRPIDRLLRSIARSFGQRAVGVVLSGMLDDGADGARELREAGGCVVVQADAEYGSMPQAVMRSGGADLALPLSEIAALLIELAAGATVPRARSELEAVEALFAGDGHACAALRAVNWTATPLGPVLDWSEALTSAVLNMLGSPFHSCIYWGPEFTQIYNEAFLPILGARSSPAGKPARLTWPELWDTIGPRLESVRRSGEAAVAEDQLFQPERQGDPEELYFSYAYSALREGDGGVGGVLATFNETTERVRATRRLKLLRDLAAIETSESVLLVAENVARALADDPLDLPFALVYLFGRGRALASLAASVGVSAGTPAAPHTLRLLDRSALWPLTEVVSSGAPCTLHDLASRLPGVHSGPWPEPPSAATLLPLWDGSEGPVCGVLAIGLSPRLRFDASYEDFVRVIAQHVSTAIGRAEARTRERERADRLAELDRAKVEFFSNVSHEFRTPLTLLLGPLEELLARRLGLPADLERAVDAAARNGRRLLRLVNTLLDFSESESRRQDARFQLLDLCALTGDIASAFRSAIESGGLTFHLRCDPALPHVWVDAQMWEKVVSNLLSNALKFTFEGEISVELNAMPRHAELVVSDSGIGIPKAELPNLFKRFHRVRGARARSAEGSGIGLSIVDELVKRLGGQLRVRSNEDVGTAFTVWIPYKSPRVGAESSDEQEARAAPEFALQLARDAERWTRDAHADNEPLGAVLDDLFGPPSSSLAASHERVGGRILVVDDNADMRDYLERLLNPHWQVRRAADGQSAFALALESTPDVILADVMMPGIDGFELLKRVRSEARLRHTPVVLLTARASEKAAIEGLLAGADDYIAKPFSPRELVARVAAVVERARAGAALRESEERFRTLLKLSDALRPLAEAPAIPQAAVRVLGQHLDVDRVLCAELTPDGELAAVHDEYQREGLEPRGASFSLAELGAALTHLRSGELIVSDDEREQGQLTQSSISVPLIRDGRLAAVLLVQHGERRAWTAQEVELVRETAERTWAAVERARTEAEVRARNEELERFNRVTVGRELRMIELKRQINALQSRLGEPRQYAPAETGGRNEDG